MLARWSSYFIDLRNIYFLEKRRIKRKIMPDSNIMKLDKQNTYQWAKCIHHAVEVLKRGGIIAVPTDTLYGVCTLAKNAEKLYRLKGRPDQKPLGLFIDYPEHISNFAKQTVPESLLKNLFPGPITVIFHRSQSLPIEFNRDVPSIGFRIPQCKFIRDMCQYLPYELIAQTSANISGTDKNPLCIEDFRELWDDIDLIIDAGPITENNGSRQGSTVIDLTVPGQFKVLRTGCAEIETREILHEFGLRSQEEVERQILESGDIKKPQIEFDNDIPELEKVKQKQKQIMEAPMKRTANK